jgi:hypothetical protein
MNASIFQDSLYQLINEILQRPYLVHIAGAAVVWAGGTRLVHCLECRPSATEVVLAAAKQHTIVTVKLQNKIRVCYAPLLYNVGRRSLTITIPG